MFRNFLGTALNSLLKNKLFSLINIGGLAIGLAACILIGLYVRNETSYDRHWTDAERICINLQTLYGQYSGQRPAFDRIRLWDMMARYAKRKGTR